MNSCHDVEGLGLQAYRKLLGQPQDLTGNAYRRGESRDKEGRERERQRGPQRQAVILLLGPHF